MDSIMDSNFDKEDGIASRREESREDSADDNKDVATLDTDSMEESRSEHFPTSDTNMGEQHSVYHDQRENKTDSDSDAAENNLAGRNEEIKNDENVLSNDGQSNNGEVWENMLESQEYPEAITDVGRKEEEDTFCAGEDLSNPCMKQPSRSSRSAPGDNDEPEITRPGAFPIAGINNEEFTRRRRTSLDSQPGAFSVSSRASGERPAWSLTGEYEASAEFSLANSSLSRTLSRTGYGDAGCSTCSQEVLIEAEPVEESATVYATAKPDTCWRRNQAWFAAVMVLIIIGSVLAAVLSTINLSGSENPTSSPTTLEDGIQSQIIELIQSKYPQTSFSDPISAQSQAAMWVAKMKQQNQYWYTDDRILRQYSLVTFFLNTSKDEKENFSWLQHEGWMEVEDECKWYGVECNKDGSILSLKLSDNNLHGKINSELSVFSETLSTLDLSNNNLVGQIPVEIGKLSVLKYLYLNDNDLAGSIPSSIGDAANLVKVNMANNSLTSAIPNTIGELLMLESIDLGNNELVGSIPSEIGTLSNIREINCQQNRLTYEIPSEIGYLTSLEDLNLQNNDLLGPLPSEIGLLKTLRDLNLSDNHIFFKIPVQLYRNGALASLESLDLSNNLLSGMLYEERGNTEVYDFGGSWQKLRQLRLNDNYFKRKLPRRSEASLYSLPDLEVLDLSSNFLTGALPDELSKLSTAISLDLSNNQLVGPLPEYLMKMDRLHMLNLSDNKFEGTLSSRIGNLSALHALDLSNNHVSGSLPSELGSLTLLTTLHLSNNKGISGSIPKDIGSLTLLESLDFSSNTQMTGTLPTEIGELSNLEFLDLSENRFFGPIPTEYGSLTALTNLYMHTNLLNSTIPSIFANFTRLEELNLKENRLTGLFPNFLGYLSSLRHLNLGGNQLKGSIPSEIGLVYNLTSLILYSNSLTGSIPGEIGDLQHLESLSLTNNLVSGSVPLELANLVALNSLRLSSTRLSGSIPNTLCDNVPTPNIMVDCEQVACSCTSCRCSGSENTPTVSPSSEPVPSNIAEESLPPTVPIELPKNSSCSSFESISTTGSLVEGASNRVTSINLPFNFNWGGTKNFSYLEIDRFSGIFMGDDEIEECYQGIATNMLLIDFGPPRAYKGTIYSLETENSVTISWEGVQADDGSNDPYFMNFQAILYPNGNFELRWGEGAFASTYQILSGASDTCRNIRTGVTGDPFQFGVIANGVYPTNQCRMFVPDGDGFYTEEK